MGSDSDLETIQEALDLFEKFEISYDLRALSAHRSPERLRRYVQQAEKNGVQIFIAAAGGAAHLPGVVASITTRPVLGIPIHTKAFDGIDSLLAILQMPAGVPVATMAVGKAGARNAAILAAQILALGDRKTQRILYRFKQDLAREVVKKDLGLQKRLRKR